MIFSPLPTAPKSANGMLRLANPEPAGKWDRFVKVEGGANWRPSSSGRRYMLVWEFACRRMGGAGGGVGVLEETGVPPPMEWDPYPLPTRLLPIQAQGAPFRGHRWDLSPPSGWTPRARCPPGAPRRSRSAPRPSRPSSASGPGRMPGRPTHHADPHRILIYTTVLSTMYH